MRLAKMSGLLPSYFIVFFFFEGGGGDRDKLGSIKMQGKGQYPVTLTEKAWSVKYLLHSKKIST